MLDSCLMSFCGYHMHVIFAMLTAIVFFMAVHYQINLNYNLNFY